MPRKAPRNTDALALATVTAIFGVSAIALADIVAHGSIEPAVLILVTTTITPLVPALIVRYGINPEARGTRPPP